VLFGKGLRNLALVTAAFIALASGLIFFYAPIEADQGFVQKIFYLHVPLAIVALSGWVAGGIFGIQLLRTGDRKWDYRSYVAIHMSLIYGVAVLLTGAIWAKASWGHWWVWGEPTLVSFLIVFLLYCTYQPMRFSIADPEKQGRYAAVFAITAGAFVPLNFIAVRLATPLVHPRVFTRVGGDLPGSMRLTWLVSLVAISLLFVTLCKLELTSKGARDNLRRLRRRLEAREEAAEERVFVGAAR
jgi:heme exporter protein C